MLREYNYLVGYLQVHEQASGFSIGLGHETLSEIGELGKVKLDWQLKDVEGEELELRVLHKSCISPARLRCFFSKSQSLHQPTARGRVMSVLQTSRAGT